MTKIGGENTERILEAVITWKLANPFQEPQITQIAAMVGISGRTLSRYFPNKEDLLGLAAMRYMTQANGELSSALLSAAECGRTAAGQLRSFFCAQRDVFRNDPVAVRLYAVGNMRCVDYALRHQLPADPASEGIKKNISGLLEAGKRDGSVRADLDTAMTVALISTGFNGLIHQIAMTYTSALSEQEKEISSQQYKEFFTLMELYILPK